MSSIVDVLGAKGIMTHAEWETKIIEDLNAK
jgi:hypothetical protein